MRGDSGDVCCEFCSDVLVGVGMREWQSCCLGQNSLSTGDEQTGLNEYSVREV